MSMNLKEARIRRGLTQEQLQTASGIDQTTISGIETGRTKKPSWDVVARLAKALETRPEELFPVEQNNTAQTIASPNGSPRPEGDMEA